MKTFLSENIVDYQSYTFSYTLYAIKESQSEITEMYDKGFLPYTGNASLEKEVFYLARSLRVNISRFSDTSENRRVNRMVEPLNLSVEVVKKDDFNIKDPNFVSFCERYIEERIGEEQMNHERLEYLLSQETGSHFFIFKSYDEKIVGYVYAALNDQMVHYWFAFFDTEYMRSHSLGKWMMWKVIDWAKENNLEYAYLGTAYLQAALYKIRDFRGLEFWDGNRWNEDIKLLKRWCKKDKEPKRTDRFKEMEDPNQYLNDL